MPSSSSREKTLPVGLCGVFSTSNFVRSVKALSSSSRSNFPCLGIHISEGTNLPSGEKISEIKNILDDNLLGVMLSCVSPENYELNLEELKKLDVPFGFKLNGFKTTKPKNGYTANYLKTKGNPNEFLGHRLDLTPEKIQEIAKKFKEHGATIIGGCCETRPSHIEAMAKIK